jgi:membrane protein
LREKNTSLWRLPARSWLVLLWRVWCRLWEDEILGRSGELAYFFLLSVFPLLLFLTTLLGYMAGASYELYNSLFRFLARISPSPDITALLQTTLAEITQKKSGTKLYLSLAVAIWLASNAMVAITRTLNAACGFRETRPIWKQRGIALLLTIGFAFLIVTGLGTLFYGVTIGETMADRLGMETLFVAAYQALKWPLALLLLLFSFDLVYNYAPDLKDRPRRWLTPGAVIAVFLWLLASFGLRFYLGYFNTYTTAYGSLGAVILLLSWFYLTALSILVGGEFNSEILRLQGVRRERPPRTERGWGPANTAEPGELADPDDPKPVCEGVL